MRQTAMLRLAAAWLVLPLVLFITGCDGDDGSGMVNPPTNGGNDFTVANYDTTDFNGEEAVRVSDVNGSGIGYTRADGSVVTDVTWTSDKVWLLDSRVFVNDGQTLTIEPGTVIRGLQKNTPEEASVLIVAQGGTIEADGETGDGSIDPIIFTSENDVLDDPSDDIAGEWGGVILLGFGPTNNAGEANIEGIPTRVDRGEYGGDTGDDNSGTFRYVSIRNGGTSIGANNEINGLTMGGVGNGTTIEYVEVYNNLDDGFEWFGGNVNTRYLAAIYCGDDAFDIDQGFSGLGQFWLAVQDPSSGAGHGGEHDGASGSLGADGEQSMPFATPQVYNATYVGTGLGGDGDYGFLLRDNFAGSYFNSVFASFPDGAIEVEDLRDQDGDSRARFEAGTLKLESNVWYNIGDGSGNAVANFTDAVVLSSDDTGTINDGSEDFQSVLGTYLSNNNTLATNAPLQSIDVGNGSVNPQPAGDATSGAQAPINDPDGNDVTGFIESTTYRGAFDGTANWADWTYAAEIGIITTN